MLSSLPSCCVVITILNGLRSSLILSKPNRSLDFSMDHYQNRRQTRIFRDGWLLTLCSWVGYVRLLILRYVLLSPLFPRLRSSGKLSREGSLFVMVFGFINSVMRLDRVNKTARRLLITMDDLQSYGKSLTISKQLVHARAKLQLI